MTNKKWPILVIFIIVLIGSLALFSDSASFFNKNRTPASGRCLELYQTCRGDFECCSFNCANRFCKRVKPQQQGNIGDKCYVDSNCNSKNCFDFRCIGSEIQCAKVSQYCIVGSECCSNNCHFFKGVCVGSEKDCASVGMRCVVDSECCSRSCNFVAGKCIGTEYDLARYGEYCITDYECESENCDFLSQKCR